jgi:hypothetical protein
MTVVTSTSINLEKKAPYVKWRKKNNEKHSTHARRWNGSVGIVTGYRLDVPGSIPSRARFFSSPQHPDQL